ncbi:TMEM165/GDT1 family protein [Dokdonella soli]|uniref:TMEM165/GDT1 family protein n=1 Tax=Dokdonella soli TaxID=529810 RepID=UPI003611E4B4
MLAAKYRRPWPICIGILCAILVNHAIAGSVGALVAQWLTPLQLKRIVAVGFFAVAAWTLVPDQADASSAVRGSGHGVLVATTIAYFLAEMGDKTQVATVVLAAQYHPLWQVIVGTTAGMLLVNLPVVWLGTRSAAKLPLRSARISAAALFAALGLWIVLT